MSTDVRQLKKKGVPFYPKTHAQATDGLTKAIDDELEAKGLTATGKGGVFFLAHGTALSADVTDDDMVMEHIGVIDDNGAFVADV